MKYLVRAIKYFLYFAFLFILIMAVLVLFNFVNGDIASMFRNGWKSIWQIAIFFALVGGIYPRFGFVKQKAAFNGEYSQIRQEVIDIMEERGYKLESENGENLTFRLRSKVNAIFRMLEDRITMTRTMEGFEVEGLTKDVMRIVSHIEYKLNKTDESL